MVRGVLIQGDGIAACCCAHRLRGLELVTTGRKGAKAPVLLISGQSQALLAEVFEDQELFRKSHQICKRIVAWGNRAHAIVLPHSAAVVSEQDLLDRLWARVSAREATDAGDVDWKIITSGPLEALSEQKCFGSRIGSVVSVRLKTQVEPNACWVESAEMGWLFLVTVSEGIGSLLCVGGPAETMLGRSRLIGFQVAGITSGAVEFPVYPRILSPLCGPGWLACGTAAITFDPLCGDGAANAIREAILASALLRALSKGSDAGDLLAHYSGRLIRGFLRHLELCREFYVQGRCGPFWDSEIDRLEEGIEWIRYQLKNSNPSKFRLNGFELEQNCGL